MSFQNEFLATSMPEEQNQYRPIQYPPFHHQQYSPFLCPPFHPLHAPQPQPFQYISPLQSIHQYGHLQNLQMQGHQDWTHQNAYQQPVLARKQQTISRPKQMFHQQSQVDYQHFIPLTDGSFDVSNCYQYPPPLIPIGAGQAGHAMDTTFPPQTMINKPFMKNRPNGLIYRNISPSNNTFGVQESRGGENQAKPSKKQGIQQSFSPSEQSQHKERSLELDQSDRQGYELSPSPFEQLEEPSLRQNQSEPMSQLV